MTFAVQKEIGWGLRVAFLICLAAAVRAEAIIYVDASAQGANNGTSWADAFTDLQSALAAAESGAEIWVARGTYRPAGPGGDREIAFEPQCGVALYGGFEGGASTTYPGGETDRSQRDVSRNETILCGDLNGDDGPDWNNRLDNSFNVVRASGTEPLTLDGFTVRGGDATSYYLEQKYGGGINAKWGRIDTYSSTWASPCS